MRPFARLRSATGRTYSKAAEFVAATDQAMRVKDGRVRSYRNGRAGVLCAEQLDRLKNSTPLRPMPWIFTMPTWHGRNTLPAVA
jgi:hypothetical protein